MKTTSQVAALTGISVRTLQYYDEIGLLTPTTVTDGGYRLYDDAALECLQQILFFKELGFQLKDIRTILTNPDFDKLAAYHQQKTLLCQKRDRLNRLISLLEKLEKGETCMEFQDFDLSNYVNALEQFKASSPAEIIKHWGSLENFDSFIQKVRDNESTVGKIAIKQFGSIEKYTEAMKYNMEHFSEIMERAQNLQENQKQHLEKSEALYRQLTADLSKDVASAEIQQITAEIVSLSRKTSLGMDMGQGFWHMAIESYSNEMVRNITDQTYGTGAAEYIANALRYYFHKE